MYLRVLGLLFCVVAPAFGQGAGSEYPMRRVTDMFQPLSRPAEMIHVTAMLVLLISAVIFVIVTGLLIYIVIKFRRPANDDGNEPPQIYGSTHIELAWTVIPVLIT
ncbi:MAG: cytochrome c oxidase subunit II transmembrane domain-containing protein, partial [Terrimicrobiaceae bacterium]